MKVRPERHKPKCLTGICRAVLRGFIVLPLALATGCSTLGYYARVTAGEIRVLHARKPIDKVLADPDTTPALRARLQLAQHARIFASDVLKLPRNRSFTTYADIHRSFVTWNVFATPTLSVQPIEHCFPFAGCVAYQGFFDHARAQALADELRAQGDDVWVGGVPEYSTLGHFADPLLSTMDDWSDDEMVGTIFHELAHQQVYVKGDTEFNESFATFVQHEGLREWHAANHLAPPDPAAAQRLRQFTELVLDARARLKTLYADDVPDTAKLQRKQEIFGQLRTDYAHLRDTQWHRNREYDHWFDTPLNNAKLVPFGLYDRAVPAFATVFDKCNEDWTRFYAAVRKIGEEPAEEREAFLGGTTSQAR